MLSSSVILPILSLSDLLCRKCMITLIFLDRLYSTVVDIGMVLELYHLDSESICFCGAGALCSGRWRNIRRIFPPGVVSASAKRGEGRVSVLKQPRWRFSGALEAQRFNLYLRHVFYTNLYHTKLCSSFGTWVVTLDLESTVSFLLDW